MKAPKKLWYDSKWLRMYCQAVSFMEETYPHRTREFIAAFEGLRTRPNFKTLKLRGLFGPTEIARACEAIESAAPDTLGKHEILSFGRQMLHDPPYFSELQGILTGRVSELVGEEVEGVYSFMSLYNNLGVCDLHMDAPSAKWTLDICIERSCEWPIQISEVVEWPESIVDNGNFSRQAVLNDPKVRFRSYTQKPGDALLFSGSSQWHYRDRIPRVSKRNFAHLVFFHYAPAAMLKLVWPETWPEYFGISELNEFVGPCGSNVITDYSDVKHRVSFKPNEEK